MDSDELIPVSMDEQVEEMEDLDISYRVFHPAAIIRDKSSQRNINVPFSSLTAKYRNLLSAIIVTADLMEDFDGFRSHFGGSFPVFEAGVTHPDNRS